MTPALAHIALDEFTRRRASMRRAVHGGYSAALANHNAQMWLAIAFACGARPPEAEGFTRASDIADPREYLAELARARDAAVQKAINNTSDRELSMRSFAIASLALHLGASGPSINREREAA